ncbi:unnamed protein product, partial [Darwinula stevensoni]
DDVVLALTTAGTVKVWTLTGKETKGSEPLFENESKELRALNALFMTCCIYNQRIVLIVCSKYWQIYDAGDFSLLTSVVSRRGDRWLGGDFLTNDRVILWSDSGHAFVYQLPANCNVDSKDFHNRGADGEEPFLYCMLSPPSSRILECPPAFQYVVVPSRGQLQKYLLRGDCDGRLALWVIPEVPNKDLAQIKQETFEAPPEVKPVYSLSLQDAWDAKQPPPPGILDQLEKLESPAPALTATIYLPQQGRLVCGREDGHIFIVPATHTVMLQVFHGRHQSIEGWPPHQVLYGHTGRVTCLLYPHHAHSRYDVNHLVSGGVDFSVCLWDLFSGALLHRFCVHAGEVTQLLVPPHNCSTRVQQCICSVASDHSVTLLSLKERKCILLASRHIFPITAIKWRPLDDFMVVGCSDGTVYIWQMESGHLDRVIHGMNAEETLSACDENANVSMSSEGGMANPAIHFFRGLRHRNLAAIRHAAQRGLDKLQGPVQSSIPDSVDFERMRGCPLMIQGLKTNPQDADAHVLFFDIEALIIQLLSEEYRLMSPNTMESHGLIQQAEYMKVLALTQSGSPDAQHKIVDFLGRVKDKAENMEKRLKEKDMPTAVDIQGFLAKVKEGAESVQQKIQAKAESLGRRGSQGDGDAAVKGCTSCRLSLSEI